VIVQLVTDRRRLAGRQGAADQRRCLLRQAEAAVAAAVDVIQLREPDLGGQELLAVAVDLVSITRGSSTKLVVNDRLDVALAAGADGVHLPGRGFSPLAVRRHVPADFLIGRSIHGPDDLGDSAGADYLVAGTLFPTPSKPEGRAILGLAGLAGLVRLAGVPVLAIGGVSLSSAAAIARTGAAGIAAIGLFMRADGIDGCGATELRDVLGALREAFGGGAERLSD